MAPDAMVIGTRVAGRQPTAAARDELAVYERLRAGRRDAFTALAVDLDPVLRDLAGVVAPGTRQVDALVRHTWEVALAGLDLFAWRCSLRAWIAGVLVGWAGGVAGHRAVAGAAPPSAPARPAAVAAAPQGPPDWADLPWGARWSDVTGDALAWAQARLGIEAQQALVLRDGHGWDDRDACDALGLTEARYLETLAGARLALHDGLALLTDAGEPGCAHDRAAVAVGGAREDCDACALLSARLARVTTLLAGAAARPPVAPDPALLAVFRRWRAARRRGLWRRLTGLRPAR